MPFAPRDSRIAELILRRGQQEADAIRRSGEISGQMFGSLGQIASGAFQQHQQYQADAPKREMEALQLQSARDDAAQRTELKKQDQALVALFDGDGWKDPANIVRVVGPERGAKIAQGISALMELQSGAVKDARENAGRLAVGVKALSPTLQQQWWPSIREAAIKGGLGTPETIPEQATPEYLDAVVGWATGQAPAGPEEYTLNPGDKRFRGNEVIAENAKPAEPEKMHAVTVRGPGGRPITKLIPESQLTQGVEEYREPNQGPQSPVAVIGPDGKPMYVRASEAYGKTPASNREQGRPVISGDANRIADLDTSLDDLNVLAREMGVTGAESWFESKIPDVITSMTGWGADAKARQGVIDRVKQVIGKALEGGVLRKEDEYKYAKILPKLGDEPSVAASKIKGLFEAISTRRQTTLDALGDAGYDVSRFVKRPPRQQGDQPGVDAEGWIDLGDGVRIRERKP